MQSFGGNASTSTPTFVGLGGVPGGSGTSRLSSGGATSETAKTSDLSLSHWQTKKDNQTYPILDTPVAPELMVFFEGLQEQMKNHKTTMAQVNHATSNPRKVDSISSEIDRIRFEMSSVDTAIHRQDLQLAMMVKDVEEINKISELIVNLSLGEGGYTFGGLSKRVLDFMKELVTTYFERMTNYKAELEQAEAFTDASSTQSNVKDLESSFSVLKDAMIRLAAQVHNLHEDVHNELSVHENLSEVFGSSYSHWVNDLKIGDRDGRKANVNSPLKKWQASQARGAALGPSRAVENLHDRLHSTLDNSSSINQSPLNSRTTPLNLSWTSMGSQSQPQARIGETTFSSVGGGGAGDGLGFTSQSRRHQHYFPSPAPPTTSGQGQCQLSPASLSGHKRAHN